MPYPTVKHLPALSFRQGPNRRLFAFAATGDELSSFLTVTRIHREGQDYQLAGYQRPEVVSHITKIRDYLLSNDSILPNALVVALNDNVHFKAISNGADKEAQVGHLRIPVGEGEKRAGWIVDGQQRLAALQDAQRPDFQVCVVGFIASSIREQREQFILVNSTKSLPRSLIYELLPATECRLPSFLERRKFPAELVARLNYHESSPFHERIRMQTHKGGIIKDTSVLKMIEHSLSDGVLHQFRQPDTGEHNADGMLEVLYTFWKAVAEVFPTAWSLPPRRSRLTHGAGIVSMGFLMDTIADVHSEEIPTQEEFVSHLEPLIPVCQWTEGYWEFGPENRRQWNELQNKSNDINLLANYLLVQYRQLVLDGPSV
jgi:DGQHR domain-containing protein